MDHRRFDDLTSRLAARLSRRQGAGVLAVLGLGSALRLEQGEARSRPKQRKRRTRQDDDRLGAEKKKKKKKKCKGGTLKCGKTCVTAATDALNCGGCGNRCGGGQACTAGVCRSTGPVACPTGQVRCNGQCVDTSNDEAHCGGCGRACQGDLTCLGGTCGCAAAAETACPGNTCVDTRTDAENCGGCGVTCPGGETCIGGECQATGGCSGGQVSCGGECVDTQSDTRHCGGCNTPCSGRCIGGQCVECVTQADCGGYVSHNNLICQGGRCVCARSDEGICQRYSDRSGTCHVCCPGGSEQCPGIRNEVCFTSQIPGGSRYGYCDCPTGWDRCEAGFNICVEDTSTDPRHCGRYCTDCHGNPELDPQGICCNGACATGCSPGSFGTGCYPDSPCGPNCLPCGEGSICCNMGPGTLPRCIPNVDGFCYIN